MGNPGNIEAPGSYVGGHKDIDGAFLELADHRIPLRLGQVSVKAFRHVSPLFQGFRHFIAAPFRADKDDGQFRVLHIQEPAEGIELLPVRQFDIFLFNEVDGHSGRLNFDQFRILQECFRQFPDRFGHGGGEKHGLPFFRNGSQNGADIIDESHIHHFVPFIEDKNLHMGQVDGTPFHMVHEPARGGYNNVRMLPERFELPFNILSPVNGQGMDRKVLGQMVDFFGRLDCQFPGRGKNHRLGSRLRCVNPFQDGNTKGCGFSCPGLGLADQVLSGHCHRNRCLLDRSRFFESHILYGLQYFRHNTQFFKSFVHVSSCMRSWVRGASPCEKQA